MSGYGSAETSITQTRTAEISGRLFSRNRALVGEVARVRCPSSLYRQRTADRNRGVGHNTDKAGKNKHGESEGFRPGGQTGNPCCIFDVVWCGVLNMRVYQYVHVGEQHPGSASFKLETDFVVMRVKCSRPVEVNSNASLDTPHSHQMERLLRSLTALRCVTQRFSYESIDTHAAGFVGCAVDLSSELFIKRYCGSHDAQGNMLSPLYITQTARTS